MLLLITHGRREGRQRQRKIEEEGGGFVAVLFGRQNVTLKFGAFTLLLGSAILEPRDHLPTETDDCV